MPEIVKDAIRLQIPYLWLQEGVVHEEAAAWAEAAGIKVVMDRCILKDRMAAGCRSCALSGTRLRRKSPNNQLLCICCAISFTARCADSAAPSCHPARWLT